MYEEDAWYLPNEGQFQYGAGTLKDFVVSEQNISWPSDNEARLTKLGARLELTGGEGGLIITVEPGIIQGTGFKSSGQTKDGKIEPSATQKFASAGAYLPGGVQGVGIIIRLKSIIQPILCPDGVTVVQPGTTCPPPGATTKTCLDGTTVPISSSCPPPGTPTRTCPDGTVVPATATCPAGPGPGTTTPVVGTLGLQPLHIVAMVGAGLASVVIVTALVMTKKE